MAMRMINIHQAKTHLSRLVEEAKAGQPFIIAKAGKAIAKVVPIEDAQSSTGKRKLGQLDGLFNIPEDFDTMFQKEIEEMFYGKDSE
jgi:prevent-host-death family protein